MRNLFIILTASTCLSGCAGVVTAWKNDPLQVYSVKEPSVYAMTGDRRTAIFTRQGDDLRYCAESLPEAVAVFSASSAAKVNTKAPDGKTSVELGFNDGTSAGLMQTFQRTEIAELARQIGWTTCLAWSQGAITPQEYHALLQQLVAGSVDVMKVRANQAIAQPAGAILLVPAPGVIPTPTPTPTPMPTPTPAPAAR